MTSNNSSSRLALVWGARGFIGSHLVPALLRDGWRVRALTRRRTAPAPDWSGNVEWFELGEARQATLEAAVDGAAVVFNLAGASGAVASNNDPIESLDANCRLQLEFLAACARTQARPHVVFASSRLVYAPAGAIPVCEDHPTAPLSIYAAHKLCVEHYHRIFAQRGALTFTICRISNPYGVDRAVGAKRHGFVNSLIQNAIAGRRLTIFGDGLQLRDYIYIDDLVTMLKLCHARPAAHNQTLNLGCGHSVRIVEAAEAIRRVFGGGEIEHRPWPRDYEQVESGDFVVNIRKAQALLAYAPVFTLETGLRTIRAQRAAVAEGVMSTPVARAAALG